MNGVQEDLGTARREYISTVDSTRLRNTRVEVIEATRRSNVPGSVEQRVAEANKSRLEGWATVYKKIGDTGDLEHLDNLLNGQSHRLQLNNSLRDSGVHNHAPPGKKSDNSLGVAPKVPVLHGPTTSLLSSTSKRPRVRSGRTVSKTTQPVPKPPQAHGALDQALDVNNGVSKTNAKSQKPPTRSTSSALNAPTPKTWRPLGNFARKLSTPEAFLAVARSVVTTRVPEATATAPMDVSDNIRQSSGQNITSRSESIASAEGVVSTARDLSSDSMSLDSSEEQQSQACPLDKACQLKEGKPSNTEPHAPVTVEQDPAPRSPLDQSEEILLDLSCATPSEFEPEIGVSPALEELKGLDFTQSNEPQDSSISGIVNANRELAFGEISPKDQKPSESDNADATLRPIDEELAEEYQREIDIICELLERTTLSETFLSKLTECKEELESRLRPRRVTKPDVGQSQHLSTPKVITPKKPENAIPAPDVETPMPSREISSPQTSNPPSQSRLNAAAPQFTPKAFTQYRSLSNATSTDSSSSFHSIPSKVLAQPQSEGAPSDSTVVRATNDRRSPPPRAEPISTDSTIFVTRTSDDTHIFGDHLLPGGGARKQEESHIFGDHLLPGRPVTRPPVSKPSASSAYEFVLSSASAPKPFAFTFSLPQQLPNPTNSNTSISSNAKCPDGSELTPNAPQFVPAKDTLCLKPTNVPASAGAVDYTRKPAIMESIHAPKPKSQPAPATESRRKPSFGQGLMGSRYADTK
ncbi:uncharacterized protein BJX67DRAFT_69361 [Aspergillus lucknowensis]|uniref:Uncharacterized protein n=1 Tax=Aspergillus lucknowensis TaxID=176173 RepID=A0ABR4LTN2_9EURO